MRKTSARDRKAYILVYTHIAVQARAPALCEADTASEFSMEIVKIRRVGNSNVLSVPRAFVQAGYEAGQPVLIEQLDNGDLLIRRVESHRALIRETMRGSGTTSSVSRRPGP